MCPLRIRVKLLCRRCRRTCCRRRWGECRRHRGPPARVCAAFSGFLVDVGRGAKNKCWQPSGDSPRNHNKKKQRKMFPNNNHGLVCPLSKGFSNFQVQWKGKICLQRSEGPGGCQFPEGSRKCFLLRDSPELVSKGGPEMLGGSFRIPVGLDASLRLQPNKDSPQKGETPSTTVATGSLPWARGSSPRSASCGPSVPRPPRLRWRENPPEAEKTQARGGQ